MNWRVKGKVLIVLLMLSVLISSCEEDDNTIGFPVEKNLNVNYFEYTVPIEMIWVDSVLSQNLGTIYAGQFDFRDAGFVEAIPYISYTAQAYDSNINVPHNALFKDLHLNLDYTSATSVKTDIPVSLEILQLTDTIAGNKQNFIQGKVPYEKLIGQKSFIFYPDTLNAEQTSDTVEYSEQIDLDNSLGQSLLNKLKQRDLSVLSNYEAFDAFFKGITIAPSLEHSAILGFSPKTSTIVLEYTYVDEEGEDKEGKFTFFPAKYFHNISPNKDDNDLANAAFSGITCCYEPYNPTGDFVYQLFGTGISMIMDLSAMKNFSDSLQNAMINSASLVIDDVVPVSIYASPPNQLAFYLVNERGMRIPEEFANQDFYMTLPTNEIHRGPLRVGNPVTPSFEEFQQQYKTNVTLYLQELIEDESTPAHLLIENATLVSLGNSGYFFLRRATGTFSAIKVPKGSVKLKVYYTTLN